MKHITVVFLYLAILGLFGIQFATILDDPQHLAEHDPNCPICLAAKTQVCFSPHISIIFTPNFVLYLVERAPSNQVQEHHFAPFLIRAPPNS